MSVYRMLKNILTILDGSFIDPFRAKSHYPKPTSVTSWSDYAKFGKPPDTVKEIIKEWLWKECGLYGSKTLFVEINGAITPRLVNVILFSEFVMFNDVDNLKYRLEYANPNFFEMMEKVTSTGRL